jgi:arylsulfatase A-like enzyme
MLARSKIVTATQVTLRQTALFLFCALSIASAQTASTPVILISVDTLRADHLSAFGYTHARTPNIDSLADHGTVFTQADCQIPFTMPSHASMLTSVYPFENQIEENAVPMAPGAVTLASVLHSHGYKTAAFIGTVFMERQMGLDQGFDFYDSPFNYDAFSPMSGSMFLGVAPGSANAGKDRRDGALVMRSARQWLSANSREPFFAFVHLFDMHKPYGGSYDAQLAYIDKLIGGFKQTLIQLGVWDKALVIFVSDHGESLGDHGESSHGYFIYESTLHVPLIVHWPSGSENHPARVSDPVGLIDVAPTVLDFLHLPAPPSFEGVSLLGTAHSGEAVYGESVHARDAFGWAPLRSLRAGQFKYIEAPRPELYNLQTDPRELNNIYVKTSPIATDLRNRLQKLLVLYAPRKSAPANASTPAAKALLNSLGYLAPGPRTATEGSGADPKDRLPEFRMYEDAQLQLYYRKMPQAIATLQQILERDPHNLLARRDLGSAYVETGDFAKSRTAFLQVLSVAPDDYMANYEIGVDEENLGLLKEAKAHLEAACRIAPESQQSRHALDVVTKKLN